MKKKTNKKFLCFLLVAIILLSVPLFKGIYHLFATTAKAQEENGFYYRVEAGNCVIVGVNEGIVFGNVNIPDTLGGKPVTGIDDKAFEGSPLTSVAVPKSINRIGSRAFNECVTLTEITVASDSRDFLSEAGVLFSKDKTLLLQYPNGNTRTQYVIPHGVRGIEDHAFFACGNITNISVPKSVNYIGNDAFCECNNLTNVNYGGSEADWNKIDIRLDNRYLTGATRQHTNEASNGEFTYVIYNGKVIITGYMGSGTAITVPAVIGGYNVSFIDKEAFAENDKLTNVTISDGIETVGAKAFYGCSALQSVTIGNSVNYIGDWAFEGTGLVNIFIPQNVKYIGDGAFNDCYALTQITVNEENQNYSSEDGVLLSKDKTSLLQYPNGNTRVEYTVPQNVREIKEFAFYGGSYFTNIFIPESVTQIGDVAFSDCDYLKNVSYGGSQTDWNNIKIGEGNEFLAGANITYGQEGPDEPPEEEDYTNAKLPEIFAKTARYKNIVTVKITATGIPQNGYFVVDGYKIKPKANGTATFETQFQATAERSFKARIEDSNGNIKVEEKTYRVVVDNGFFAKIVAFFIDFLFNGFKWREAVVEF